MPGVAPRKSTTKNGLPRRVKLAVIELAGIAVMVIGGALLVDGDTWGLVVLLVGIDVVARPTARRLPRAGALLDLIAQWRRGALP